MSDYLIPLLSFEDKEYFEGGLIGQNALQHSAIPRPPVGMGRLTLPKGGVSPLDKHSEKEAWFIATGSGRLVFQGSIERLLKAGDIVVFDSEETHIIENTSDREMTFFSIWWD